MDVTATFSAVLFLMLFSCAGAYDPLDPTGNVTMKWDIMFWTTDGYIAIVKLNNFQTFRHFMKPGWTIGPTKLVPSNRFLTPDGPRRTKALMTWNVTCTYSQFMARRNLNYDTWMFYGLKYHNDVLM
ncbi:hypothetical protein Peur_064149 [Populus x canadensis]